MGCTVNRFAWTNLTGPWRWVGAVSVALVALGGCSPSAVTSGSYDAGYSFSVGSAASGGMIVEHAQGHILVADGYYLSVTATITNRGQSDDRLIGASSPAAGSGGLYATAACGTPPRSPGATGLAGKVPMKWWLVRAGETVELRAGAGEIILAGLTADLSLVSTVEVSLLFEKAGAVVVLVPVTGGPTIVDAGWGCAA
jgi:copper(I)-binding protein